MVVVAELEIPADAFDLGRLSQVTEGIHIELERVVPTGNDGVMPFFWASGPDHGAFEAFESAVRGAEVVERLTAVARVDDRVLYHVVWADSAANLTEVLVSNEATILEAHGDDPWRFRLRFADHRGLREFHNYCLDHEIAFRVERIYTLDEEQDAKYNFDLTPEQQSALTLAVEHGYFSVPRGISLKEIAEELGISQQAASERVRRGAETVLQSVLLSRSAADLE
ncbi:helix-turn-helix domain-containing protein [Haloprofundus salinisoli]|uniref:helix-turn-helix domain-containing protein n=1 Tax=Haloprofundus salinisoli TaxID=2876193 RepID=UPI001CCE8F64|nr:helix-turn-helix domain-containing protein [Haloprofundus salinisoli]